MLTQLAGGRVVDPAHRHDAVGDVWIEDGRIVAPPDPPRAPDYRHDVAGAIVMAGGIDIHSHIAGTNVNTARLLLPELHDAADGHACGAGQPTRSAGFTPRWGSPPSSSRRSRRMSRCRRSCELAAIPFIDTATLTVLGNDDFLLRLLRDGESGDAIADYCRTDAGGEPRPWHQGH